jgi:hypothetical protein
MSPETMTGCGGSTFPLARVVGSGLGFALPGMTRGEPSLLSFPTERGEEREFTFGHGHIGWMDSRSRLSPRRE